ncbi:FliM/FliN family flagellar motor C-terminal domain-containing protein [Kangiella sp. HZ709]|uniref:FliM/FliN family flagellar motor C-terminal domain-containing protein n=1 Tax=Kangiella sp. HZ709 TaxID=2666328 RepID=UPI0012AFD5FB|nr:FliM/FliN family flagellar motor C-terminal domain-containing protein [Kangiella sp. HZ709]MRX26843.1 hypothetical protein [Kangiella sp. HZ709]
MSSPIIFLSDNHKEILLKEVSEPVKNLFKDWLLRDSAGNVITLDYELAIVNKATISNSSSIWHYKTNASANSIVFSADCKSLLLSKLVPSDSEQIKESKYTDEIVSSMLQDLMATITSLDITTCTIESKSDSHDFISWYFELKIDNESLFIQLPNHWLAAKFSKQTNNKPLVKAISALGKQDININISLNNTTIKVNDTLSLSVGDVLKLEHKIFEPLNLRLENSVEIAKCNLGKDQHHKSILVS